MPYGLIDYDTLKNIARAIRYKANTNRDYRPRDMAQAINTIKSGGGYDVPVLQSTSFYGINNYDNSIINRSYILNFEIVNNYPENNVEVIDVTNWGGISPDNVTFYRRRVTNYPRNSHYWDNTNNNYYTYYYDGWIYGLYVNSRWNTQKVSIIDMYGLFNGCQYIDDPFCGELTTSLHITYAGCSNVREAICGNNVVDMSGAYMYCYNLVQAACGPKVKWFSHAYNYCQNLVNGVCGPNVIDMTNSYSSCYNMTSCSVGENVKKMNYTFSSCYNLVNVGNIPNTIESMYSTFNGCWNLTQVNIDGGENLAYARETFNGCNNLLYVNGGDLNNFKYSCEELFNNCCNLLSVPNIFVHSESIQRIFYNCTNITNINFRVANFVNEQPSLYGGYSNFNISYAFYNCQNLTQESYEAFMPDLVNYVQQRDGMIPYFNPQNTYYTGDIVKYNNYVYWYYGTEPFTGEWNSSNWSSRSIYNFYCYYAFFNCKQLTKVWYSNLMNGSDSGLYVNTGDIEEIVFVGDIVNFSGVFQSSNIHNAACPDTVVNFTSTFSDCHKIVDAVCGNNVERMAYTYRNCRNLVNAVCGPNVITMEQTYFNCPNVITSVCGENVNQMLSTYKYCNNLQTAVCGNLVTNLDNTYGNCLSLTDAVCGENVIYMNNTYANCLNLINSACGNNVISMLGAYFNCQSLTHAIIGSNVAVMINAYYNCQNITQDVEIPSNMYNMINAFYNCRNINNYYIGTNRMTSYGLFANAFFATSPYNRRNIVVNNRTVHNALINTYCRAFWTSSIYYTNENYETPVEVNVNGNTYNCVRCAYNATYNCYIYCME